jgi:hypothetical protein
VCKEQITGLVHEEALKIKVSSMLDWRMEALMAIHELVEVLKCKHDGVSQAVVDKFDFEFERLREERIFEASRKHTEPGITSGEEALIAIEEPGDQATAPYRAQHCLATGVERIMAYALDVTWADYEVEVEKLH